MTVTELLSDRSAWTKGYYARSKENLPVYPESDEAVCWCVAGAMRKCYPNDHELNEIRYKMKLVVIEACLIDAEGQPIMSFIDANDLLNYDVIYPLIVKAGI